MLLNLFLRLAVVSSVIYCTMWHRPAYLWIPFVMMAIFLARGILAAQCDAVRIDALADQTYFLAYSATVSSLVGLLGHIYLEGEVPTDLRSVEMMGAIALLTTLLGLVSMFTL